MQNLAALSTEYMMLFLIGGGQYSVSLANVQKVLQASAVTPVVKAVENSSEKNVNSTPSESESCILGSIFYDRQQLPVVDLRTWLDLPRQSLSPSQFFIIVSNESETFALVVDKVCDVIQLPDLHSGYGRHDKITARKADNGIIMVVRLARLANAVADFRRQIQLTAAAN